MNAATHVRIPQTLEELTPAWFDHALAERFPAVRIASVRNDGFLGYKPNKTRVHLEYAERGSRGAPPATVIVKGGFKRTVDGVPASGLDIGVELELLAYAELTPKLPVSTPDCFHVEFDAEGYEGIMILEDLAPSGVRFLASSPGLEYAQAAAFMDAQARFHAAWLDSDAFRPGGVFDPDSGVGQRTRRLHEGYLDQLVTPIYWDKFTALPRGALLPRMLLDADRMAVAYRKMDALHRTLAPTIVHGDEHLGNLYLNSDGSPGFIDWCARREPWVMGFTYFLLSCVDSLHRRDWERPLLALYLERLARYGARPPVFDEAWYAYRCTTIYPMLTWLSNSAVWQPEAVNTRNTARAAQAVIDHDALRLLGT